MQSAGQGDTSRKRKWDVSAAQGTCAAAVNALLAARAHQGVAAAVQRINKGIATKAALSPSVIPTRASVPKDDINPIEEVIINDAEPSVRIQLTKRSTQDDILRDFGCVAITRGRYRPRATLNPDNDEKPLYLAIQASSSITDLERKKRAVADAAEFVRNKILGANKSYADNYSAVPAPGQIPLSDMGTLSVYVGVAADSGFNTAGRLRGPNDSYFQHIMSKTGATAQLRGSGSGNAESSEPLHVFISCDNPTGLKDAKRLVEDLIQTVKSEYLQSLSPGRNQTKQLAAGPTASSLLQHPMYQGEARLAVRYTFRLLHIESTKQIMLQDLWISQQFLQLRRMSRHLPLQSTQAMEAGRALATAHMEHFSLVHILLLEVYTRHLLLSSEANLRGKDQEEPAVTSPTEGFDKLSPTVSPQRHKEPGEGDIEPSGGGVTGKEPGKGDIELSSGEEGGYSDSGSDLDRRNPRRKTQKFQHLSEDIFWYMESDMQMEGTTHEESSTSQRPHYTGSNEDDREEFCLALSRRVTGKQRAHRSSVRRALNGPMMLKASPEEKKNYKKNSQPGWQGMYEELPSFRQSTGSDSADGTANCADQPFHLMDRNATWVVARPATEEDDDGEVSDEYLRDGNSLTGLAGCDGKESTVYYWALRKVVHELNKKFLMRGTKEKNDMLKAVPQTALQDGVTLVSPPLDDEQGE
ncbi:hypothetical protein CYMTET_5232 [Cymbomonas tetramitiformis]|uniref:Protein RIK n=1 Tax=Cymbomonas tetramitiformis TaxID=36881 RepID=A0AAE0GZU9_9CHLO|nr:hypothetical protein CYMTET_5232 [Cymbomonas tetramitiformis]